MDSKPLYQSPFTDIDPMGVEGVFDLDQTEQLIHVLNDVRAQAAACRLGWQEGI